MQFENIYQELTKMTYLETRFRQYFETHGYACPLEKMAELTSEMDLSLYGIQKNIGAYLQAETEGKSLLMLTEDEYFTGESDIVVTRNMRYTFVREHEHTFFEIMYLMNGEGKNVVDGSEITMRRGDFCIIPPRVSHSICVESDSVLLNILVRTSTFTEVFLPMLRGSNILSDFFNEILYSNNYKKYMLFHTNENKSVLDFILQMYAEQKQQKKHYGEIMNGLLIAMSGKLLQMHEEDVEYPASYVEKVDMVPRIIAYIRKNCTTITLAECAAHFHFNSQYLSSLLKKHTNHTFLDILKEERMQMAAELLTKTSRSVKEIAFVCGYQESAYFMKVFKKNFGCTPSDYRSQYSPRG